MDQLAPPGGIAPDAPQAPAPLVPSGRELTSQVSVVHHVGGRRARAHTGRKAGWAILGVLIGAGALGYSFFPAEDVSAPRPVLSQTPATINTPENQQEALLPGSLDASSPRQGVEPGAPEQPSQAPDAASVPEQPREAADLRRLVAKGDHLLALGDVASARLVYRLAARDGSAAAATAMGSSYDPVYLKTIEFTRIEPNPAEAMKWYKTAIARGAPLAEIRLRELIASLEKGAPME